MSRLRSCMKTALTLAGILALALGLSARPATADMDGKKLLQDLISQAKKEGTLDTAVVTQVGPAVPGLKRAFNKRFGLDLDINVALGDQAGKIAKMLITLRAGGRPSFDTLTGSDNDLITMAEKNYSMRIENWQSLLAAINPAVGSGKAQPKEVSPSVVAGQSFIWATRTKALVYNTQMTSEADIPQGIINLADPKFSKKFTVAPWTDTFEQGVMVYKDKKEWLDVCNRIGKNARGVMRFQPALNRIMLKEFPFTFMNSAEYLGVKLHAPNAPINIHWFTDYTPMSLQMYTVPVRSRHPAAATLWTLWMTTPEAQAIYQKISPQENLIFGQSKVDQDSIAAIKKSGTRLTSYLDSPETVQILKWWATDEGAKYRSQIKRNITQRR